MGRPPRRAGGSRSGRHARYYTPVDLVGLYWRLVDLIWIYLFPLLYLIR
jgi:cytochrome c oxidase subunit 3